MFFFPVAAMVPDSLHMHKLREQASKSSAAFKSLEEMSILHLQGFECWQNRRIFLQIDLILRASCPLGCFHLCSLYCKLTNVMQSQCQSCLKTPKNFCLQTTLMLRVSCPLGCFHLCSLYCKLKNLMQC